MYDEMFTHIASKAGGIQPLLDNFFSFLERKTDFYVQFDPADKTHTSYKMGFPKGNAEKMVIKAFRQYPMKDYNAIVPPEVQQSSRSEAQLPTVPSSSSSLSSPTKAPKTTTQTSEAPCTPPKTPLTLPKTPAKTPRAAPLSPSYTPEGKQYPIGNGGIGENYYWTQTLKDVTVYIDTASGIRGKDVKCVIKPQSLSVEVRGESLLNGALEDVVKAQESMWTISSTTDQALQQIVITLDKTRPTWWKHVLTGHEEIDTTKVFHAIPVLVKNISSSTVPARASYLYSRFSYPIVFKNVLVGGLNTEHQ